MSLWCLAYELFLVFVLLSACGKVLGRIIQCDCGGRQVESFLTTFQLWSVGHKLLLNVRVAFRRKGLPGHVWGEILVGHLTFRFTFCGLFGSSALSFLSSNIAFFESCGRPPTRRLRHTSSLLIFLAATKTKLAVVAGGGTPRDMAPSGTRGLWDQERERRCFHSCEGPLPAKTSSRRTVSAWELTDSGARFDSRP